MVRNLPGIAMSQGHCLETRDTNGKKNHVDFKARWLKQFWRISMLFITIWHSYVSWQFATVASAISRPFRMSFDSQKLSPCRTVEAVDLEILQSPDFFILMTDYRRMTMNHGRSCSPSNKKRETESERDHGVDFIHVAALVFIYAIK